MPKDSGNRKPRGLRKQSSSDERRDRARRVREQGLEMTFRCGRCEKKNLRCFVDTASGRCAGCISVHAECSLFVPEEEWEKVEEEERNKRLELARAEESAALAAESVARALTTVACAKRELLELEGRKQEFARRD
ncbi:hypothetical protein M011DRAFT_371350, partial [Sporormia fimetaria CBS 119925]